LVESQQELEASFENAMNRKSVGAGDASRSEVQSVVPADVKSSAAVFALALKQHPLTSENIEKVQSDRFKLYSGLLFCKYLLHYVAVCRYFVPVIQ